ncbi:MAG: ATP-dependent zinc metalloprotease FtsH, partial [Candidatus Moranbacteria bacterium]|nr:ATP-dependent zinc metalloprotease FtsH [Candidatus Moranbacteria bacterium]
VKEKESSLLETLKNYGLESEKLQSVEISMEGESGISYWLATILPILLPFILIAGIFWLMLRQAQKGNAQALSFGLSRARWEDPKKNKHQITFKDVAGAEEAKEELKEVVEFLREPQKFHKLGAKIPRGVLLLGPPGCGKTLLAKATSGEAGVPFFHISGSEFVEMFVGVGASRVRDLFNQAKKNTPSIVFIDEIDAVGRHRGAGLGGGHDEREQTLNQILVEMDGFDPRDNVIVIAATNRPDVLDPALLRPGRFDRRVIIELPDIKDRIAILKVHARRKPLAGNVHLKVIAQRTPGFSGADLANLVNEAAILAGRKNQKIVTMNDLLSSIEKVILGPERRSRVLNPEEKKIVAVHEAGHAVTAFALPKADPVHKISIISRGQAGGYTINLPAEDKHFHSRSDFLDKIVVYLGGYVAEELELGEVTTGASSDLKQATRLAKEIITKYGMSEMGPVFLSGADDEWVFLGKELRDARPYSEQTAAKIDDLTQRYIVAALARARKIIKEKRVKLREVTKTLLEKETLEREEFEKIMQEPKRLSVVKDKESKDIK